MRACRRRNLARNGVVSCTPGRRVIGHRLGTFSVRGSNPGKERSCYSSRHERRSLAREVPRRRVLKCLDVRRSWRRVSANLAVVASGVCALACFALPARAQQQVVVANLTYTATAQNTTNSEYRVPVLQGAPTNWKAPVDFTAGKAYARFEVLDKPSANKTLYNVCFALADKLSCMPLSPPYTQARASTTSRPRSTSSGTGTKSTGRWA